MTVPARISVVTLGVADLPRAVAFYEALGWQRASSSTDAIAWFRTADTNLGLFPNDLLAADANLPPGRAAFGSITLAIDVESETEVERLLDEAVAAGATLLKPATNAGWGGVSGYFADPDGHPWEIAWVPEFTFDPDGRLRIP